MGNWIKQQALKSAKEEQQLTYAALVLGALVLFFQSERITLMLAMMLMVGCLLAYVLAEIGNVLLKK